MGYRGFEYGLNKPYSIEESIEIFTDDDLLFKPGTAYFYSSFDWVFISLAMEEVLGSSFKEYVKIKVLEPLGMHRTFDPKSYGVYCDELGGEGGCGFYFKDRKGFRQAIHVDTKNKLAGGGYFSTSEAVAKLGLAHLQGMFDAPLTSQFLTSQVVKDSLTFLYTPIRKWCLRFW